MGARFSQQVLVYQWFFIGILIAFCLPVTTSAAETRPTCTMSIRTDTGFVRLQNKTEIYLRKGEEIELGWKTTNAKQVTDANGNRRALSGSATSSPKISTVYMYHARVGSKKVKCSVHVIIVDGGFSTSSLRMPVSRSVISGTSTVQGLVHVVITNIGSTTPLYTTNMVQVSSGKWKIKMAKKIPDGMYTVSLRGNKNNTYNTIAEETLVVGKTSAVEKKTIGALVVLPVPLLVGGSTRGKASVAVSYLQVINTGNEEAILRSFYVTQKGSASKAVIADFVVVDDYGGTLGSTGNKGENVLVSNTTPIQISVQKILLPRQTTLFTIRAFLASDLESYLGTQFSIDVTGVETQASVKSVFPIHGATWTIGI